MTTFRDSNSESRSSACEILEIPTLRFESLDVRHQFDVQRTCSDQPRALNLTFVHLEQGYRGFMKREMTRRAERFPPPSLRVIRMLGGLR